MEKGQEESEIEELLKPKLPTKIIREAKVQSHKAGNGIQFSVKIPIAFVEELNIKKGDIFIFELDPATREYSIKLKNKK